MRAEKRRGNRIRVYRCLVSTIRTTRRRQHHHHQQHQMGARNFWLSQPSAQMVQRMLRISLGLRWPESTYRSTRCGRFTRVGGGCVNYAFCLLCDHISMVVSLPADYSPTTLRLPVGERINAPSRGNPLINTLHLHAKRPNAYERGEKVPLQLAANGERSLTREEDGGAGRGLMLVYMCVMFIAYIACTDARWLARANRVLERQL